MPTIADYLRLAPYSLDELVAATNGVLRGHPRLEVSRRTLRYYVAQGVLPPPSGPPKYARYEGEHLLRAVALRAISARGRTLAEAQRETESLLGLSTDETAREIRARVDALDREATVAEIELGELRASGPPPAPDAPSPVSSSPAPRPRSVATLPGERVVRLRLAPGIVLEVSGSTVGREALQDAKDAIQILLNS